MKNSKTVLIDKNPGRNCQTFGVARELGTSVDLLVWILKKHGAEHTADMRLLELPT